MTEMLFAGVLMFQFITGFTYHVGRVRELEGWNFEVIVGCTGDTRERLLSAFPGQTECFRR